MFVVPEGYVGVFTLTVGESLCCFATEAERDDALSDWSNAKRMKRTEAESWCAIKIGKPQSRSGTTDNGNSRKSREVAPKGGVRRPKNFRGWRQAAFAKASLILDARCFGARPGSAPGVSRIRRHSARYAIVRICRTVLGPDIRTHRSPVAGHARRRPGVLGRAKPRGHVL